MPMSDMPERSAVTSAPSAPPQAAMTDPSAVPGRLQSAEDHLLQGHFREAEMLCRQVLLAVPRHPEATRLLGKVMWNTRRPGQALALFQSAVDIDPTSLGGRFILAEALKATGQERPAEWQLAEAVRLFPDHPEPWFRLGTFRLELGRAVEAVDALKRAAQLRPDFGAVWANLGVALAGLERLGEAKDALEHAARYCPQSSAVHTNWGSVLRQLGELPEAEDTCRRALELDPNNVDAACGLGEVCLEADKPEDAADAFRHAVRLAPDNHDARCRLAVAYMQANQYLRAEETCRQVLDRNARLADAWNVLGSSLKNQGRLDEAERALRQCIAIDPDHAEGQYNLGNVYALREEHDQAVACFDEALSITPDAPQTVYNRSLSLLAMGRLADGWAGYQRRLELETFDYLRCLQPLWDGRNLGEKTLLVHYEQGFGDSIQFVRFLPWLRALAGRVILCPQADLDRLLADAPGVDRIVDSLDTEPFAAVTPLLSLPYFLRELAPPIWPARPYLQAPTERMTAWQGIRRDDRLNVALVWSGNPGHRNDAIKSFAFDTYAPLAEVPGVQFHSLQMGERAVQCRNLPRGMDLVDHSGRLGDFADTACVIEQMDLVISVDTAVAHLAGAMGKRVWLLLSRPADWRWGMDGVQSPWYPTMELFRQKQRGDWADVLARVRRRLAVFGSPANGRIAST